MTDMKAHLDKIRSDAAECILLSSIVPNDKREMFVKIAEHLNNLAFEIDSTMALSGVKVAPAAHHPEPVVTNLAIAHDQRAPRWRRILPWMLVIVAAVVAAAFFWQTRHVENYATSLAVPSKHEPPLAPQDEAKQKTVAAHRSGEQGERVIAEQLGALAARVDDLERALDNLKRASAESVERWNKEPVATGETPAITGTKSSAPENQREGNATPSLESQAAAKPPGGVLPTTANPLNEPVDQVGAIAIPGEAELDRRKAPIGPIGCTHFRSFDAATGTYTTLDGRRRPCR